LLATQRPDLLPFVRVCYAQDRVDNCGRCGKCILTMAALEAVGALDLATSFPPAVSLADVAALGMSPMQSRLHWAAVLRALPSDGRAGELREALGERLRRSARPPLPARARAWLEWRLGRRGSAHPSWRDRDAGFDWQHQARIIRAVHEGRSEAPLGERPEPLPQVRLRPR
jgi:hypothetical protein